VERGKEGQNVASRAITIKATKLPKKKKKEKKTRARNLFQQEPEKQKKKGGKGGAVWDFAKHRNEVEMSRMWGRHAQRRGTKRRKEKSGGKPARFTTLGCSSLFFFFFPTTKGLLQGFLGAHSHRFRFSVNQTEEGRREKETKEIPHQNKKMESANIE
jgi:hypothetical protein